MESNHEDLARAKRVSSLRGMTGLSRRAFSERYGIAPGTLQHWENAVPGISLQGAKRLIKALASGGLHCNVEWLMHGIGHPPQLAKMPITEGISTDVEVDGLHESEHIRRELELFFQHYTDAIEMTVLDDGMLPGYQIGDIVAGLRHYQQDMAKFLGTDCIVFTKEGELLLRQLRSSSIPGYYNLFCINPNTSVLKPVLYEVELTYVAPVMWLRRRV